MKGVCFSLLADWMNRIINECFSCSKYQGNNFVIITGLPVPKNIDPDFPQYFIRCYLEAKAELEEKSASSVTSGDVEQFYRWSQMCTLVSVIV